MLTENKKDCLSINGKQSVKVEEATIGFKNYFKQITVIFKIYADFECNLESAESYEGPYSKKYQDHIPCDFGYKLVCVDDKFSNSTFDFRGENAVYKFLKTILKEYEYCKKVMKKHFNKNLIMVKEEEEEEEEEVQFQSSNICWICKKLTDDDNKKVRDHCHITGKFRGAAHWNCNINLQLTKNVPVIFHNLKGFESHLIFCKLRNFDVKIDVISNRLEKYMAFFLNKNLVFIDSIQFMNSSLQKLVKNLSDSDLKYLSEECGSKNLELLKQKDASRYEYMDSFKRFSEEKLPDKKCFYSSVKDGTTGNNGETLDGHISDEDYLTCNKIWNEFNMKSMGGYHNHYLKKDVLLLADVFEKFIDAGLKFYKLDPFHYFSSPGLSWDPMLKMTGVKFHILTCIYLLKTD